MYPIIQFSKSIHHERRRQHQIMEYYENLNKKNTESLVTLSWNVSGAYVDKKEGFIKRLKGKVDVEELNRKYILRNVTGIVKPGQLCAIMGASGAGKTTLLNLLNFRNRGRLTIDGDIRINGKSVDWKEITAYSGYVQQEDVFLGTLKVKEHLHFLAMLKMDKRLTKEQKQARVEQIMLQMNLLHIQDSFIGLGERITGISGGEKRRLSFASEVLTNPQLLFCDESTSGLDSAMALSIVDAMKLLTSQGKTVICTIHQPSSHIFEKFDTVCLLGEGRVAYFGPTKECEHFFKSIQKPSPPFYNPADHYIHCLAIIPNSRESCLKNVNAICDTFEKSPYQQKVLEAINSGVQNFNNSLKNEPRCNVSYLTQTYWLIWRQTLNSLREPKASAFLFTSTIVVGILLGLIYLQLDLNQEGIQNRNGIIFILLIQVSFGYIFPVLNTFPLELNVFYRETKNRVYAALPYYLAKQLAEVPKFILFPIILVTIVYWMANLLNNGRVFIVILCIYILSAQIAVGFGLLLSILSPTLENAAKLSAPFLLPLVIFSGIFLKSNQIPDYFIWIKYLSWFYYGNECINISLWTNIKSISCERPSTPLCPKPCRFNTGQDVLDFNAYKNSNLNRNIGLMFVLLFVTRFLGYILIKIKVARF